MTSLQKLLSGLFMLIVLASCSIFGKKNTEDVVAVAFDKYLYRSELEGIVPAGTASPDSIEIARQFIDNWVRQQVLLHHAESNLEKEQKDFDRQLENYRNSLVIYEYESALIRQRLDTVVSDAEIQSFYESNISNFQLPENIIRVCYVKIPNESLNTPQAKKAKQLLNSKKPDDRENLLELCDKSMFTCRPDDENWVNFNDFIREMSLDISDQDDFLRTQTSFETNDSLFSYFIRITDYKTRESTAPLSMVEDKVRNLILNRRKSDLLNRMQQQIFEEAIKNKKIEIL